MATMEPTLILNATQLDQKINRLAYQIYEQNFDEPELMICGIAERGYQLAERIYGKLSEISPLQLSLARVNMEKDRLPEGEISLEPDQKVQDKVVILCDDVLYTGKTLAYATVPFLTHGVKKLQCLVLIQRHHLSFPVQPSYVGMALATTLQEHVSVRFDEGRVFLS